MANNLTTTTARAPGRPALAWLALNPPLWTTEQAVKAAGGAAGAASFAEIDRSIAALETEMMAVPADAKRRAEWAAAMDERLRRLASKVSPGMAPAAGDEWRKAMVEALSDLPAYVALTAAKRAMHRPMHFMNEVEFVVREIAGEIATQRRDALARLRWFRERISGAGEPALPAPAAEALTPAQVDEWNAVMRRVRARTRYRPDGTQYELAAGEVDPAAPVESEAA